MTGHNMTNQKVEIHKLRKRSTISVLVVAILVIVSNYFENKYTITYRNTLDDPKYFGFLILLTCNIMIIYKCIRSV